jgi:SAM-dependent methyltransferase
VIHKREAKRKLGALKVVFLALATSVRSKGKYRFIRELPADASLLDVGCGNNSPVISKALRSDVFYVGIDIEDYNQQASAESFADEYLVTARDHFWQEIARMQNRFDAAISSHNLEHCDEPEQTLRALLRAIKPGGRAYLSFPCEASVFFPHRRGTLNFHDDPSHSKCPDLSRVLSALHSEGFRTDFVAARYRPVLLALLGLLLEPLSAVLRRVMPLGSTWALYGFETVIWARRNNVSDQTKSSTA